MRELARHTHAHAHIQREGEGEGDACIRVKRREETVCAELTFLFLFAFACEDLMKNPVDGFSAGLSEEESIFEWSVTVIGPPDTL